MISDLSKLGSISIDDIYESGTTIEDIKELLSSNKNGVALTVQLPLAHHYSDLAFYYLQAAYIGQECSKFAQRIGFDIDWSGHNPVARLIFKVEIVEKLAILIHSQSAALSGEEENALDKFYNGVEDYCDDLENLIHVFPELVDDYYANFINGSYYEYDQLNGEGENEFLMQEFRAFPERRYRYWKSALSKTIGEVFYVSSEAWIIPRSSDLNKILHHYIKIEDVKFEKADFFAIENISYVLSKGLIVHFPFDAFLQAKHCASAAFSDVELLEEDEWIRGLFTYKRHFRFSDREDLHNYPLDIEGLIEESSSKGYDASVPLPIATFYLSEFGDHLLVRDNVNSYLFFDPDKLSYKELLSLNHRLSTIFQVATNLAGIVTDIKCAWEMLDDEKFELLCFDIIYHNPKFDNTTIRKMGKSRSRDGGRDIEIFTNSRPGYSPEKYIFQCKFIKQNSSLTASKVQDIVDTVIKYGAKGYGIMTNVVIDSTLFDKLDGISINHKIQIEQYSVYQLERILARYPNLKDRHFNGVV